MAREGKIGHKRKTRNKFRLEKKGSSDESDEDYKVDEDEKLDESEDEYCSFMSDDKLDDGLGKFVAEQDGWFKKRVRKVRKGSQTRNKNRGMKPRKKKVVYSEEEVGYSDDYSHQETELPDEKPRKKSRVSNTDSHVDSYNKNQGEKDKVSRREETEDEDNDDEDDEEFNPCDLMKSTRRNPIKERVLKTKNRSNPTKESKYRSATSRKKKWGWVRSKRKSKLNSDSDFVSSGSSDYEYTISEEEREQVREATEFRTRLPTSVMGSSSLKIKEKELLPSKRQRSRTKGKEKLVDMKLEVEKQVCGVCLSEEGKRTVRGFLNCCSHYFCFACILEWSKVESRCPLCKQRFTTIRRTNSLKDEVFSVPERNQVYQPSEEELRDYIDPYANVVCIECQHGGDDALMLLCDQCDSPAHTYCVGLGYEVPDGNWYCNSCRPRTLSASAQAPNVLCIECQHGGDDALMLLCDQCDSPAHTYCVGLGYIVPDGNWYCNSCRPRTLSASAQAPNLTPDHGAINNISAGSSPEVLVGRETFDLNEEYVPDSPSTPSTGYSQSPRHHSIGHVQATPALAFGSAAATLYDRRRIQEHIRQLRNNQQLHPSSGNSNTRADASRTPYQLCKQHESSSSSSMDVVKEEGCLLKWRHESSSSSSSSMDAVKEEGCLLKRRHESSSSMDAVKCMEAEV